VQSLIGMPVQHSRPWISASDRSAVEAVLQNGMIARGAGVQAFERAVSAYLGTTGGIACNSGTAAITLALKALGVGEGDEVVMPTYVCWNVLAAVKACGASPRLCDVNEVGVCTVDTVRAVLSQHAKAIIAVHTFGHKCDIGGLELLGLPIIEDACQAFGLMLDDYLAGSRGTIGVLSFQATKCLTTGEGGMLVTNDEGLLARARSLSQSSGDKNAMVETAMSDLQAALGLAQLERYTHFLERRSRLFAAYHSAATRLETAGPCYCGEPLFLFRFTLKTEMSFESAQSVLLKWGVHARRGVDELLHRRLGMDDLDYSGAVKLYNNVISVPFYPSLTEHEQAQVLNAMRETFGGT
jgi:perosamine synthetase